MGTKREKRKVMAGVTREMADDAFATYAKAAAEMAKIGGEMELECARIRERYAERLSVLESERGTAFDMLQAYATEHQAELFARRKSLEMAHGVIGFRTGTPKLKTVKGMTWGAVLRLVKEYMPDYIRTTEEVAKDKLLADRLEDGMTRRMNLVGLTVVQEESFYVEPKQEGGHE